MVHGTVRHIFRAVGGIVLVAVVAAPLLIWRLSQGPLDLDFLTPSIRNAAVAKDGSWRADLDRTVLALGHGRHMVEIQAQGVRFYLGDDDKPALAVPVVAFSFNARSLLSGILAPSSIRIEGPHLRLTKDETGHVALAVNDDQDVGPALPIFLMDELTGEYDPMKPGRQLREFSIVDAQLTIEDTAAHQTWSMPSVNFEARRNASGGTFDFASAFDRDSGGGTLLVNGSYDRTTTKWLLQSSVSAVHLAHFSTLDPRMAWLSSVDFPLSGQFRFEGDGAAGLNAAEFDVKGDSGRIRLADPVGTQYPLSSLSLKGTIDLERHQLKLIQSKLVLEDGATFSVAASIGGLGSDSMDVFVEGGYDRIAFDSLKSLWPTTVAPNPREWIVANLSKGVVHDGSISLTGVWKASKPDDFDLQSLSGKFKATGLSVNYISPMPQVHDGWGTARFDQKAFRVDIEGGQVTNLKVVGGTAVFGGLDQADQFADISVSVAGQLPGVLSLIDQKPLGYASAMGIDPAAAGGDTLTKLSLRFPLLKNLRLDDIAIKVHSDLDGARLPKVVSGLDLTHGKLALNLDAKGMDVVGAILLGGIPATLEWRENFSSKTAPFRSRYVLRSTAVDAKQLSQFGLDTPPFVAPWMEGNLGAVVTATMSGSGKADIAVDADLTQTKMSLPGLDWRKEVKTTGNANIRIVLDGKRIVSVPEFNLVAGDLKTGGNVAFNAAGRAQRVEFKNLSYGRTVMDGALDIGPGGVLSLSMKGPVFDATPIVSSDDGGSPSPPGPKDMQPIHISAQFKQVWLSRPGSIEDMTATLIREKGDWRTVTVRAKVGSSAKDFIFEISPQGPVQRKLKLTSPDAGAVMKAFDAYNDLVGGTLSVEGRFDDDKPNQPLTGTLRVNDYNVVHTPALARLLTVASLTGVVDVLKGEGISFSVLEAPFTLSNGLLKVKDARATGTALGLTANGEIDMDRDRLKLDGTLVPFYTLNSALGGVPVLGWLLNGGETGGGQVAFNFSMKGSTDEPEVTINPLSALTPGFLRHLFDIFDTNGTSVRKGE